MPAMDLTQFEVEVQMWQEEGDASVYLTCLICNKELTFDLSLAALVADAEKHWAEVHAA